MLTGREAVAFPCFSKKGDDRFLCGFGLEGKDPSKNASDGN